MKVIIYHNSRCRKSREALALLQEKNIEALEVREYLKQPLNSDEFKQLLQKLNMSAHDLIRKNESVFKNEYKGLDFNNTEWIQVFLKHPKLMERPIVEKGNKAVVARPPEKLEELF